MNTNFIFSTFLYHETSSWGDQQGMPTSHCGQPGLVQFGDLSQKANSMYLWGGGRLYSKASLPPEGWLHDNVWQSESLGPQDTSAVLCPWPEVPSDRAGRERRLRLLRATLLGLFQCWKTRTGKWSNKTCLHILCEEALRYANSASCDRKRQGGDQTIQTLVKRH